MPTHSQHLRRLTLGLTVCLAGSPCATLAQSAARGQMLFESRCVACHSLDENRVGPALRTVLGRKAGTAPDFDYSPALAGATHRWTGPLLRTWLTDPEKLVPGQRMGYRVDDAKDRDDLVTFLSANGKKGRAAQ